MNLLTMTKENVASNLGAPAEVLGGSMKTTSLAATLGVASVLCAGSLAAGPSHPRDGANQSNAAAPALAGTNNGAACKVSFATSTSNFVPPDDLNSASSAPYRALAVAAVKPCMGNVIAFFTSEVNTSGAGDFIHVIAMATCVATAGLSNPCTVGQQVEGSPGPGHLYLQGNQLPGFATNSVIFVFPNLNRGQWRFEILVGGNSHASLGYRTLVVEMFGA